MQVTSCLGSESSLLICSHTPLGSNFFCNALTEVGVRCVGMLTVSRTYLDVFIIYIPQTFLILLQIPQILALMVLLD